MNCLWDDLIEGVAGGSEPTLKLASVNAKPCLSRQRYSLVKDGVEITITMRERETLKLIAEGLTVPQAARQMDLSPRTVEFYVKTLRYKFKSPSKHELVKYVNENNTLSKLEVTFY